MLFNDKKRALSRAAIGGLVGTAVLIPVGGCSTTWSTAA